MNISFSDTLGTCVVQTPWLPPNLHKPMYASLRISHLSRKQSHTDKRQASEPQCKICTSLWAHPSDPNNSDSRSFEQVTTKDCVIPTPGTRIKMLGAFNAKCTQNKRYFTWVVLASKSRGKQYRIILLRFVKEGLKLEKVYDIYKKPLQVIVLRGPLLFCVTAKGVLLLGKYRPIQLERDENEATRFIACATDLDQEGVVLILKPKSRSSKTTSLKAHNVSGTSREWQLKDVQIDKACKIAVSMKEHIAAIAYTDGSISLFDIKSGECKWKMRGRQDLENPRSLLLNRGMVIFTCGDSKAVWGVNIASPNHASESPNPVLIFPAKSVSLSSQTHEYFIAPWRESILLCSDVDGRHCRDYNFDCPQLMPDSTTFQSTGHMGKIIGNLEARLGDGVNRVIDAAEVRKHKRNMLNHARSLLVEMTTNRSYYARPLLFKGQLKAIKSSPRDRNGTLNNSDSDKDGDEIPLSSKKITMNGNTVEPCSTNIVHVLSYEAGVDESSRFIVVRVFFSIPGQEERKDSTYEKQTLRLIVNFDHCMKSIFDVECITHVQPGKQYWLSACCPISSILSNHVSNLGGISLIARIDSDTRFSQIVGTLRLTNVLSNRMSTLEADSASYHLQSFQETIQAIAKGPYGQALKGLSGRNNICPDLKIEALENLTFVQFRITNLTELALAVAMLRANMNERAKLRGSCHLPKDALSDEDKLLRLSEREMQDTGGVCRRRGSVGYEIEDIYTLLLAQEHVDNAKASCEEKNRTWLA